MIHVCGTTIPRVWEEAIVRVWDHGHIIKTQYDKEGDPPSRDAAVSLEILEPMTEPRIHRCFPGGLGDLETYRAEVVYGVHDYWCNTGRNTWSHTYHQRFSDGNQIDEVVAMLKADPFTRRAVVLIRRVYDLSDQHAPCLTYLWYRVVDGRLDCHCHIRSNDAFKAAGMNIYAFTELQAVIAARVGVPVGVYRHFADSFHIYGSYFSEFEGALQMFNRGWKDKTFDSRDFHDHFIEAVNKMLAEGQCVDVLVARKQYLERTER